MDLRAQKERKRDSKSDGRTDGPHTHARREEERRGAAHAIGHPSIHSNVIIKQALLARIGERTDASGDEMRIVVGWTRVGASGQVVALLYERVAPDFAPS